jgi:hypothetical protein
MQELWVTRLRDQCEKAGVDFFSLEDTENLLSPEVPAQ